MVKVAIPIVRDSDYSRIPDNHDLTFVVSDDGVEIRISDQNRTIAVDKNALYKVLRFIGLE